MQGHALAVFWGALGEALERPWKAPARLREELREELGELSDKRKRA